MAAVVADKVIVELEAKLNRYEANVRKAEQQFNAATRAIERDSKRLEASVSKNADGIGARFRLLAGTFATAFSAQQVSQLADGYTRFTNQLKVAGLEGSNLAGVQEQLFLTAQKNGVELESLGTLYSRSAQVSKELGASQAELLQFTNGVAAALRVQGGSAASAQGALLQLSQALGSGTVRAEEFNSINEGALPILKAVAQNLDGAGGSVAKLKNLVNDGKVSSDAFFRAFLAGSGQLEEQASKASLTISASFTVLNNALGKFIGQTDASLSATERISQAIILLSENLDTVATAVGVLSAVMLGRFTAGMVGGAASTGLASTAIFALQARAVGAATTMEALALTSRAAGASMLAAFGGPVGLAVAALAAGIGYLYYEAQQAEQALADLKKETGDLKAETAAMEARLRAAGVEVDGLGNDAKTAGTQLIGFQGVIADTNERLAELARNAVIARLALIGTQIQEKQNAITRLTTPTAAQRAFGVNTRQTGPATESQRTFGMGPSLDRNTKTVDDLTAQIQELQKQQLLIAKGAAAGVDVIGDAPGRTAPTPSTVKPKPSPKTDKSPDFEAIERRFLDDMERGRLEIMQAKADAIGTADAARAVERERIESDRASSARAIAADKDLNDTQRAQLLEINEQIAAARSARVKTEELAEAIEHSVRLREEDLRNEQGILRSQLQLADTTKQRKAIELRLLDLQYEEERIRLRSVADNTQLAEAERQAARARLKALEEQYGSDRAGVERNNESPFEQYQRRLNRSSEQIQEEAEQWVVDELDGIQKALHDGITNKLGVKDPILSGLIDLVIEQLIMKPLADAFAGAAGAGGGGLGGFLSGVVSSIGGLFRASGGHVVGGKVYDVNENGIEGFQPAGSGKIIPLGRMRGAGSGGMVVQQTFNIDASGVNPEGYTEHIKAAVRQETVAIVGAGMKQVSQATPGRLAEYQRDTG